jgi:hypothetical protein
MSLAEKNITKKSDLPFCGGIYSYKDNCYTTHKSENLIQYFPKRKNEIYIGEFKNNKMHGQGTYFYNNGDEYKGSWKDSLSNGQGIYTYQNGNKYKGDWKDGDWEGKGTFIWSDASMYKGTWKNGKIIGIGTITFSKECLIKNCQLYLGEYKKELRHGNGRLFFADGNKYIGEFKYGKRWGQGKEIWSDGYIEEGIWRNNHLLHINKKLK